MIDTCVLAAGEFSPMLIQLLVILATAGLVAVVSDRLHLATIPAYLIAGMLLSPLLHALGAETSGVEEISTFALILLIFGIGLHLDLSAFRGSFLPMVIIGVGSTLLTVGIAFAILAVLGMGTGTALVLAMAAGISSTAVVLRVLQNRRQLRQLSGRLCFATLIIQDILVIVMLAVLTVLAGGESEETTSLGSMAVSAAKVLGIVVLLVLLGRIVLPRLFEQAARTRSAEVILVLSAATALGAGAIASAVGLSPELGAFLAGFLLSATPFRFQISGQIVSLRDLFMAVFFTSIGMTVNLLDRELLSVLPYVLAALPLLILIKTGTIMFAGWIGGARSAVAFVAALSLAQAGEFSIVLLKAGRDGGLVPETVLAAAIVVIVLSLMLTPFMIQFAHAFSVRVPNLPPAPWMRRRALEERDVGPANAGHVIIAGFGPVGRATAERFDQIGVPYTVIELNPRTVAKQGELGKRIIYGDAANVEVLHSAGIEHADALVLTMPDDDAMVRACRAARSLAPGVFIAARATYLSRAMLARAEGADHVVVEEVAAAEAMQTVVGEVLARRGKDGARAESP